MSILIFSSNSNPQALKLFGKVLLRLLVKTKQTANLLKVKKKHRKEIKNLKAFKRMYNLN